MSPIVPYCQHAAKPGACDVRGCPNHPTDYVRTSEAAAGDPRHPFEGVGETMRRAELEAEARARAGEGPRVDASGVCDHGYPPGRCTRSPSCPNAERFAPVLLGYPIHSNDSLPELVRSLAAGARQCKHAGPGSIVRSAGSPLMVCLDCGSSSVEPGQWRPPALALRLGELDLLSYDREAAAAVDAATLERARARSGPYAPHLAHLAPVVERLDVLLERLHTHREPLSPDEERARDEERREQVRALERVLDQVAIAAGVREAHYLRQLEHGSRILERVVELVEARPVVYRGERLTVPSTPAADALAAQYNAMRHTPDDRIARGDVVELLEDLDRLVFRVAGLLATSVPFATLRRWCADLAYPRAALAELLARIDCPPEPPPVGHGG